MIKQQTFKDLGISNDLIAVLEKKKIINPTEIQKKAIPSILKGRDVVGISATGSGKTLAFSAGILENLEPKGIPQTLILAPTRELADQIASAIRSFATKKIKVFAAYGGVNIQEHIKKINSADVVVATPGRLLDLMNRVAFNTDGINTLVFDEFDRMLDMGFYKEINPIVKKLPEKRQTMLFSATKNEQIKKLIEIYTKNPLEISVSAFVEHTKLEQVYYRVENKKKYALLVHLLRMGKTDSSIIFCSHRLNCDFISENLNDLGMNTMILHGGLDQKKRIRTLKRFHKEGGILVCTDVVARGLDIKNVNKIYNYDLPRFPEEYIHRIGRTARAGKGGKAITIVSEKDKKMFEDILEIEGVEIQEMKTPKVKIIPTKTIENQRVDGKVIRRKGKQHEWTSMDDPGLSKRFRKKTVNMSNEKRETHSKNKSRTNGSRRKKKNSLTSSKSRKPRRKNNFRKRR